jgi:uncharacterized protein (DUF1697 family)
MHIFIAILRGINVSGKNIIKMENLREVLIKLGLKDVKTYIQSGNIVFKSNITDCKILSENIHQCIEDSFGFNVPVQVLSSKDIKETIENNPYIGINSVDTTHLHVTFLAEIPDETRIAELSKNTFNLDSFKWKNKTIYLHCPGGYGNTKLSNGFFENKLKISATTRNWKTVNELNQLAENL